MDNSEPETGTETGSETGATGNDNFELRITVKEKRPFMQDFEPHLVGTPSETPKNFVEGETPKWVTYGRTSQLWDPNDERYGNMGC